MPFEIVRNDIVNMQVDAIVNTANPQPIIGYGCDAGVHKKAGPRLLEERKKVGNIAVGDAKITLGYELDAKYVIHTVGPVWKNGDHNEEKLLRSCYDTALKLALEHNCESVAFPLISAGNHGVPKPLALQTAINAFSSFLMEHEMQIYLVVFGKESFALSEKLFSSVSGYIDENYIKEKIFDEYGLKNKRDIKELELAQISRQLDCLAFANRNNDAVDFSAPIFENENVIEQDIEKLLKETDAGFSETLLKLIDRTGKKDSEVYKRANVDRKLFSKIRNNPAYKPSKSTALAFAVALELNLEETRDFIGRAGFALTRSSKRDIIVELFIKNKKYNIHELNTVLFDFDQSLLGS